MIGAPNPPPGNEGGSQIPLFASRYELRRLLGRGGMGEVHLARDVKFDRLVAIKLFRADASSPGHGQRFVREAGISGRLVHPNIVTVYDFGEHGDELYMAMEYIAGDTLAELIARRRPESLAEKLTLMTDLCAGLGYAHRAGVLHRDIKPANLMLAPSGILKIVDFGIARVLDSSTLTQPFVGTLSYMSPEQLLLAPLDERSDIFSVGAVFYELLSFQPAFGGDSVEVVADRIRFGAPEPLSTVCPGLDTAIVAIVDRALQRYPDARFPDLGAMETELRRAARRLAGTGAGPTPAVNETLARSNASALAVGDIVDPRNRWARAQARLLDRSARVDYVWALLAGLLPILLSWFIGAHRDAVMDPMSAVFEPCVAAFGPSPIVLGYTSRLNWWPYFGLLPLSLFLLRYTASRFFPLGDSDAHAGGILQRVSPVGRGRVSVSLASAALDSRNLKVALAIALAITVIDVRETAVHYLNALGGTVAGCPRELDWTVLFIADPQVSVGRNALLVLMAYHCQLLQCLLALALFGLLLRHNLFYLAHIYQRHRARRMADSEQIILDFDDVERCFGLRSLHSTFNLQVVLLIVGGLLILSSRMMNVDPTPFGLTYEAVLDGLAARDGFSRMSAPLQDVELADLFPDAGQMMLGLAWMTCFLIVALPSAVKFLPLLNRHVSLVGRRDYLLEFIPPTTQVRAATQEDVDALAVKFARSSFWPAGDERARALYAVAYFVFFFVLVPAPPTSNVAMAAHAAVLAIAAYIGMKATFWLFRKSLAHVDTTLGEV